MTLRSITCIALLSATLLAACGGRPSTEDRPATDAGKATTGSTAAPADQSNESARPEGIAWFDGSVEEAFAAAKAADKPVLLYWGAAWCPPCHQLKVTVFAEPGFRQKTTLFVPVYLDGDEAGAQRWGEHFRIAGYPTLLALNPDQTEIKRIAGGMDLNQFAVLLDDALENRQGAAAALAALAAGGTGAGPASVDACRRVAWNAWGLSDEMRRGEPQLAQQLLAAAGRCRPLDAALGLRLHAFAAAAAGAAAVAHGTPLDGRHADPLEEMLRDTNAATPHLDALRYLAPQYFEALARRDAAAAQRLLLRFEAVMQQASTDPRFAVADQLGALYSALLAHDAVPSAAAAGTGLADGARLRVQAELARLPSDPWLRSNVVTGLLEVLDALGDHEQAYEVARAEVETSRYGYYFMSTLADICESLGRSDEALDWYERSYRESKGTATRFQWGAAYLQAVLRLAPEDLARVRDAGNAVLGELAQPDAIFSRSRQRLENLDGQLRKWQAAAPAARTPVTDELRATFRRVCADNCGGFLGAGSAAASG